MGHQPLCAGRVVTSGRNVFSTNPAGSQGHVEELGCFNRDTKEQFWAPKEPVVAKEFLPVVPCGPLTLNLEETGCSVGLEKMQQTTKPGLEGEPSTTLAEFTLNELCLRGNPSEVDPHSHKFSESGQKPHGIW